ncbi:hypothetical protein H2O64_02680 [Kordia sp. YSTF-M3]|uniref:Recombinase domain-containing protein n=1 Tax=Kordia aestuariivivens TaxID=2759037 RepID=A0ABR7Q4T9_9FLAO|nr:hypothetical protein [Kordia aestuariivivens]MBC8753560.1 hypothetical protein [Kordia aestuariivivens]
MIHKEQRKKLKKVLGYHYTKGVLKILKEKKITTRKGTPYGSSMIRNVFTGLNENKDIENAIMELFIQTQEDTKKTFEKRNQILGLAGSENNTSG